MVNQITTIEFASLMGFPKPANDTMYSIVLLLSEMTILLTFIFFGVLLALAYIIDIFHAENNPYPRHFEKTVESTLDVIFVIFPTIIIVYLLIPSLGFIFNNETAIETVFNLNVVGHQWYWSYEYNYILGTSLYGLLTNEYNIINQLEFDSLLDQETTYNRLLQVDKRVIIPVNTLIQATVTSQDVIHSWAVPQLGIKYDAIPGRLITFILHSNVEGIFYGQCSELCGVNHAFTPICIQAVDAKTYLNWLLLSSSMNPSFTILDTISLKKEIYYKYLEYKMINISNFIYEILTDRFLYTVSFEADNGRTYNYPYYKDKKYKYEEPTATDTCMLFIYFFYVIIFGSMFVGASVPSDPDLESFYWLWLKRISARRNRRYNN